MSFQQCGFEVVPDVVSAPDRALIISAIGGMLATAAGSRELLHAPWCQELSVSLRCHPALRLLLPADFVAVQCTYFAKTEATNWLVAYHQDLSIPASSPAEGPSLTGSSLKQGMRFIQPSVAVLERLIAVRVHLDESNEDNGPLRVIRASHRYGRIPARDLGRYRELEQEVACLVPEGGALVFRPLLLHASSKSRSSRPRRVLHFLFGPRELPDGLQWSIAVQTTAPAGV